MSKIIYHLVNQSTMVWISQSDLALRDAGLHTRKTKKQSAQKAAKITKIDCQRSVRYRATGYPQNDDATLRSDTSDPYLCDL